MSAQILVQDTLLEAKQGVAVTTTVIVENGNLSDVVVQTPAGVAFDFKSESGELHLLSNTVGRFEIPLFFEGESAVGQPRAVIILNVVADVLEETIDIPPPIEEAPVAAPEPAIEEPVQTIPPTDEVVVAAPEAVEQPTVDTDPAFQDFINRMDEYVTKMDTKAMISIEDGIRHQSKLLRTYLLVLNKPNHEFPKYMNRLIEIFNANRSGVFSEHYINRFMNQVKMNKEEAQLFTRLNTLLLVTADVGDRKLVSQRIDFKFIGDRLKNDAAMQRLINFYNPASE